MYHDPSIGEKSVPKILCCDCGVSIEPNSANKCVGCIRAKVDITDSISRQSQLQMCKLCRRFLSPPDTWMTADLESKDLLRICLKRIIGLKKVRLVDAKFVWTEPHSKRVKVMLTIQKEALQGVVLQQCVLVEFVIFTQLCENCQRVEAKDYWRACVQVRQKGVSHKKTLFFLEQLVIKRNMHLSTTFIKTTHGGGYDFFYAFKQEAWKMVEFIQSCLPCQHRDSKELVSHDAHSNKYDYKHTFCVDVVPVCKDDVVCLSKSMASSLGGVPQLLICYRVSTVIHLINPETAQKIDVQNQAYWRNPFRTIAQGKDLSEYTVLDVEESDNRSVTRASKCSLNAVCKVCHVVVVLSVNLGKNGGEQICCKTHLVHLKVGDAVLGVLRLDLTTYNVNNEQFDTIPKGKLPQVILVKKFYNRALRSRRRAWKLKRLEEDSSAVVDGAEMDYVEFLEDLEEDPQLRENVAIYRDVAKAKQHYDDDEEDETPQIGLNEMMEDLNIDDVEMEPV